MNPQQSHATGDGRKLGTVTANTTVPPLHPKEHWERPREEAAARACAGERRDGRGPPELEIKSSQNLCRAPDAGVGQ